MKKLYAIILSIGIIGMSSCDYLAKDISEDMNFTINGDLFKNTVQIEVVDAATGQAIPSLKGIYIEGKNADVIYSQTGRKPPEYTNNIISLGVDPKFTINNEPVEFIIAINANGYIPASKNIVIFSNQFNQKISLKMFSLNSSLDYMEIDVKDFALNNGKMISDGIIKKTSGPDTVYYDDGFTTVGIPTETQFYYYEEKISGEAVSAITTINDILKTVNVDGKERMINQVFTIDSSKLLRDYTKKLYTGSNVKSVLYYNKEELFAFKIGYNGLVTNLSFVRDAVYAINDQYKDAQDFLSACLKPLTHAEFYGEGPNGKEIQVFAEPVFYSFVLDPNTINPTTNLPIKEGDIVESAVETIVKEGNWSGLSSELGDENPFSILLNPESFLGGSSLISSEDILNNSFGGKKLSKRLETLRSIVKRAPNGQLRVQGSSKTAGFFRNGLKSEITIEFDNPTLVQIPDNENIIESTIVEVGNIQIPFQFLQLWKVNNPSIFTSNDLFNYYKISVFTFGQLPSINLYTTITYFNKVIVNNQLLIDNKFTNQRDWTQVAENLPEIVTFDITLICERGVKIKPSTFTKVFVPSENAYYYANIKNGKWSTRGLELNKEIKLDFTFDNIKVDTTVILKSNYIEIEKQVGYSKYCQ